MTYLASFFPRRRFQLAKFDLAPLAFELAANAQEDALLLERVVSRSGDCPDVVALAAPIPTPGELQASIDRHLKAAERAPANCLPDARDELRDALAELRRSIG